MQQSVSFESHVSHLYVQKSILGLVQSSPFRIDVEFKDEENRPYKKTAVVKTKGNDTEELALFSNKDSIVGEVGSCHC
jgi:hypothetical protein